MKRRDVEEERNTAIFTAYEEQGAPDPVIPEKSLLLAVLMNALADLHKDGAVAIKAAEYMLSPEDDYLFSFQSVCNYLNVDPKRILYISGLLKRRPAVLDEFGEIDPASQDK
ncbi:MAG: hypothetical protein ACOX2O_09790 [Bdellovibrionota bacterium]